MAIRGAIRGAVRLAKVAARPITSYYMRSPRRPILFPTGPTTSYYVLPARDGTLVCFALAPGTAPVVCAALY